MGREKAQESRRTLFLKNVRQRADDRKWEKRGGDQEALKLEWHGLNRQWKREKAMDLDGVLFEDEIEEIPPEYPYEAQEEATDDMMVDAIAREEEAELDAMLSLLDNSSSVQESGRPDTPSLSDDEDYDSLFMEMLSQQKGDHDEFISSGEMDLS